MGLAKYLIPLSSYRRTAARNLSSCLHVPFTILHFPLPFRLLHSHLQLPENRHPVHKFTKRTNHARSLWHSHRHTRKKQKGLRFLFPKSRHNCFYKIHKCFVWKGVWCQQCNKLMYTINMSMTHCRLDILRNTRTTKKDSILDTNTSTWSYNVT
jgi:hypothetical protein